ncbi:hypothetical protein O181_022722 [Austropuccinia psidii MF-1]|uniref:Uncharacterized protein n=1 Tax=Austropuccinia psidii MF-1 TaxID=1389203 RepID=A0A9Q3CG19_9BASI|nr:hypothetical protein [Austropuccinia psidii MF-1]
MASSVHFDPVHTYDGYKAVEVFDPACTDCLAKGKGCFQNFNTKSSECHFCFLGKKPCCHPGPMASHFRRYLWMTGSRQRDVERWTNVGGPIPVGRRPMYSIWAVPISRINTERVVKQIRRIANYTPDPDAEGSVELDGEEAELVNNPVGHQSSTSNSQPPDKTIQSCLIPSTPRNFQPILATIPTSLPPASHPTPGLP